MASRSKRPARCAGTDPTNINPRAGVPLRELATYGHGSAPRLGSVDYAGDIDVHLTICAFRGRPFEDDGLARLVCGSVEATTALLGFRLHGYCLMPDHLHVLLSPAESETPTSEWLRRFKSYTTRAWQVRRPGMSKLWQDSAFDHVCRNTENVAKVLAYIVNNPVRANLATRWDQWPWSKAYLG